MTLPARRRLDNLEGGLRSITAATTLDQDDRGKTLVLNSASGAAVTLPAATGSGDKYFLVVGTTVTSNTYTVSCGSGDTFVGNAIVYADGGNTVLADEAAATDNTITFNGTTTGGLAGAFIELIDIADGDWFVHLQTAATGSEATPFSTV